MGSPSSHRKGRDKRGKQQRMLPAGGNMVKMPRQPRPKRMQTILDYLKKGVVNCIELCKNNLEKMKQQMADGTSRGRSRQGFQYNLEKQIKAAERHLRKLEFHLAKVEELQEQYDKELKVREGAENILRAYSEANSSKAKESVSEAKQQVKDCTQNMCHLEAELEVNLGVFIMKIEGIAGFARVCRGDVFEISFKYGFQKWKSKCKVEKNLSQTWENAEVMFYPMLADYLQIKVTEIRGIARSNIIIGSLEFDTSDFYQAEPQNLTIDVNEAGTIKLNVVISWSPFQIVEEDLKNLNKNSYGKRERALTESAVPNFPRPQSVVVPPPSKPEPVSTPSSVLPASSSLDLDDVPMLTLAEALHNVNRLLEILNGQYVELRSLEKQVASLESYLRKKSNMERQESMTSLSIKNALDSFNFLNEVDEGLSDDEEDKTEETNRQNLADDRTQVPKSKSLDHLTVAASKVEKDVTISASRPELRAIQRHDRPSGKRSSRFLDLSEKRESRMLEVNEQRSSGVLDSPTVDSSFGSLGRSSIDPETEPFTTGVESVDMVLVQHLMYTEYQLSHLGAFGPLKLKETIALDKLQKQAVIIEQLVMLSSSGKELCRADDILPELKLNPALLEFWEQCSEKHALYVNADLFLLQLDVKFGVKLRTNHPDIADDVFQSLGHRIIERPIDLLDPKAIITLFQYITFFAQEDRKNPERFINDLTNEFELTASLEPGNPDLPKIVKKLPKGVLLPAGNLRALALLLLEESETIQNGVKAYLESICNNQKMRQKAVNVYAECLEERDLSLRQAGCVALAAMKAREALEQLVYLLRCDMDDVKQTVKEALMTFGEEGRQAYASLSMQPYIYSYTQQRSDGPLLTTEL